MSSNYRATVFTIGARLFVVLVGIAFTILVARELGPKGRGIYALCLVMPTILSTLADIGLSVSTVRIIGQRAFPLRTVAGNNVLMGLVIGLLGVLGALSALKLAHGSVFTSVPGPLISVGLLSLPGLLISSFSVAVLLGQQRYVAYNVANIGSNLCTWSFVVIAIVGVDSGFSGAVIAFVLGATCSALGLATWLRFDTGGLSLKPDRVYITQSLRLGSKVNVTTSLGFLNLRADTVLIGVMLNPRAVGVYGVGVALIERVWIISDSVSSVLLAKLSNAVNISDGRDAGKAGHAVLITTGMVALLLDAIAPIIVRVLFSGEYLGAVGPLRILSVGVVLFGTANPLSQHLLTIDKTRALSIIGIIALATNIAMNVALLPRYGISGAAVASLASYSLSFSLTLIVFVHCTGCRAQEVLRLRLEDVRLVGRIVGGVFRESSSQ